MGATATVVERARAYVRRRLADRGVDAEELDDLCGEAVRRILEAVDRDGGVKLRSPRGYALAVADSVFADHLRQTRPNWWRLKRRVLYLLDGRAGGSETPFARWRMRVEWLAGLARWRGRPFRPGARYAAFCDDTAPFCRSALGGRDPSTVPLPELLAHLFRWLGTPVELDALTSYLASLRGVEEVVAPVSLNDLAGMRRGCPNPDNLPRSTEDVAAGVLAAVAAEGRTAALWGQVCGLLPRQREALLLGMERDDLLLLAGTASSVAAALSSPADAEFLLLWRGLPLTDNAIGARVGATAQQVSNLRKCARERLARWLAKNDGEGW